MERYTVECSLEAIRGIMRRIAAAFILLGLLAACTSEPQQVAQVPTLAVLSSETLPPTVTPTLAATATPECNLSEWWDDAEPIVEQFLDTAEVAAQTSRGSLSTVILEMRQLQRQFEREHENDCDARIYRAISYGMAYATDAFGEFMAQSEAVSEVHFMLASQYFWNAHDELAERFVFAEPRMSNTSLFIWGGDSPNAATATWMAIPSTPTLTPTLVPTIALGIDQAVNPNFGIRLREQPNNESATSGDIIPGTIMTILEVDASGDWLRVRLPDGREGWAFRPFLEIVN